MSARDQLDNDLTCSCDLNEVVGAWRLVPGPRYLAHGRTMDTLKVFASLFGDGFFEKDGGKLRRRLS